MSTQKFELGPIQKEWMKALREHPERQTTELLGEIVDGEPKMCCLGQGGIIAGVCQWSEANTLRTISGNRGYTLGANTYMALGLRGDEGQCDDEMLWLSALNDNGKTWPEIADIIEANPEAYFTHAV